MDKHIKIKEKTFNEIVSLIDKAHYELESPYGDDYLRLYIRQLYKLIGEI